MMHCFSLARVFVVTALASLASLGGCQSSLWEQGLSAGPEAATPREEAAEVRFREVPWERVDATIAELRGFVAASPTHMDEWTPAQRADHKARLLLGLQISEPADSVRLVGKSEFRTTERINVPSVEMQALANRLGADTVVWSSRLLGKADRVVQEPVTLYEDGTWWDRRSGVRDSNSFSQTRTGWVPVRIQVDEYGYIGFYLRTR
jgi:hypothetical protein